MREQLKNIETTFTALKADVMIGEANLEEREKRLIELEEQENQAKEELRQEYKELKSVLIEAKTWSSTLKVDMNTALLLLSYRELRQLHWHIDQMAASLPSRTDN